MVSVERTHAGSIYTPCVEALHGSSSDETKIKKNCMLTGRKTLNKTFSRQLL